MNAVAPTTQTPAAAPAPISSPRREDVLTAGGEGTGSGIERGSSTGCAPGFSQVLGSKDNPETAPGLSSGSGPAVTGLGLHRRTLFLACFARCGLSSCEARTGRGAPAYPLSGGFDGRRKSRRLA